MPYPNSQTPVTIALNKLFCAPARLVRAGGLTDLQNTSYSLAMLAANGRYRVVRGQYGYAHVDAWPKGQQDLLRSTMILALQNLTPMFFDWHTAPHTWVDIVYFAPEDAYGVTFRSPLQYPPYWGPP